MVLLGETPDFVSKAMQFWLQIFPIAVYAIKKIGDRFYVGNKNTTNAFLSEKHQMLGVKHCNEVYAIYKKVFGSPFGLKLTKIYNIAIWIQMIPNDASCQIMEKNC